MTDVAVAEPARPAKDDRSEREKNRDALLDALTTASVKPGDITGATVVYGDSVGADTPLLLRFEGKYVDYVRADQVAETLAAGDGVAAAQLWSAYQGDKEAFARGDRSRCGPSADGRSSTASSATGPARRCFACSRTRAAST